MDEILAPCREFENLDRSSMARGVYDPMNGLRVERELRPLFVLRALLLLHSSEWNASSFTSGVYF